MKNQFLTAYRAELLARYSWASDTAKFARFMASATDTIESRATSWNHDGEAVAAAWRAIGNKGKPTLKALRAMGERG